MHHHTQPWDQLLTEGILIVHFVRGKEGEDRCQWRQVVNLIEGGKVFCFVLFLTVICRYLCRISRDSLLRVGVGMWERVCFLTGAKQRDRKLQRKSRSFLDKHSKSAGLC
jgi:hypothetical protein